MNKLPPSATPEIVLFESIAFETLEQVNTPAAVTAVKTWFVQVFALMSVKSVPSTPTPTTPEVRIATPVPEPIVAAGVVSAPFEAIVVDAVCPKAAVLPVCRPANIFVEVAFASVVLPDTVRLVSVPTEVSDEAVTPELSVAPDSVPAGATTTAVESAVIRPLPFAVMTGIAVEPPKLPVFAFTVAKVPAAVTFPEPSKLGEV